MTEKIAVVGPRQGADLAQVEAFVAELTREHMGSILVSGGAEGVDRRAETTWLNAGGKVWSFRIRKLGPDKYGIEKWELSGERPRVYVMLDQPTFLDPPSALFYRSMLVAEVADRIVAFHGRLRMTGTDFTTWVAKEGERKPTHVYSDGEWASFNT